MPETTTAIRKDIEFQVIRESWGQYLLNDGILLRARPVLMRYWDTGADQGQVETTIEMTVIAPPEKKEGLRNPPAPSKVVKIYKPGEWETKLPAESTYHVNQAIFTLTLQPMQVQRFDIASPTGDPVLQVDWQATASTRKVEPASG